MIQLVHQERSEAEVLLQRSLSHSDEPSLVLADPRLFLRKWMGEVSKERSTIISSRLFIIIIIIVVLI